MKKALTNVCNMGIKQGTVIRQISVQNIVIVSQTCTHLKQHRYISEELNHTLLYTQDKNKHILHQIVVLQYYPWDLSTWVLLFGMSVKSFGSLNTVYRNIHYCSQLSLSRAWRTLLWNKPVCPLLSCVTRTRPSGRGLWTKTSSPWSRLSSESVCAKWVVATLCLWNKKEDRGFYQISLLF